MVHVAGKVDPVSDIETINTELALADLDAVEKQIAKLRARWRRPAATRKRVRLVAVLEKVQAVLDAGQPGAQRWTCPRKSTRSCSRCSCSP